MLWNIQRTKNHKLTLRGKAIVPSLSLPTDINKDNSHDPANFGSLPENAGFTSVDLRPLRECTMTEKGLAYWMENCEQRRKNQSYYSEIIESHIIGIQSLMVSTEKIDIAKDCFIFFHFSFHF